jgi:hypothetical protein
MDSQEKGKLAGNIFLAIALIVAGVLFLQAFLAGVVYQERAECLKWQIEEPAPARWQQAQCKNYGLELSRQGDQQF